MATVVRGILEILARHEDKRASGTPFRAKDNCSYDYGSCALPRYLYLQHISDSSDGH